MRKIYFIAAVLLSFFSNTLIAQGPPDPCDNGSTPTRVYPDKDGDFFGTLQGAKFVCGPVPNGYVVNFLDCNDNDGSINPNAAEICDGVDNNCNGQIDEVNVTRLYVKWNATGFGNGLSWANAYTKLQDALARANICASVVEIWVAEGTYYPDEQVSSNSDDPAKSFILKSGLSIYGGFVGSETALNQRDLLANHTTILSGEIQQNNDIADNSYHVVQSNGENNTAVLDGFTVSDGCAEFRNGGGIHNYSSSPTIINCTISKNRGDYGGGIINDENSSAKIINCVISENYTTQHGGGGIYNKSSSPIITNCSFTQNAAVNLGGGMYNVASNPSIVNCIFWKNTSSQGGGIHNDNSDAAITNCSFSQNTATNGGGIYNSNSDMVITNSIIWGNIAPSGPQIFNTGSGHPIFNYCITAFGLGTGNINKDPLFIDPNNGNLRIPSCSPAIDKGNNAAISLTTDLDGNVRKYNATNIASATVDIGAYEFIGTASPELISYKDADNDGYSDGTVAYCEKPAGYKLASELTATTGDCDDNNDRVHPGAIEICDGLDNNCDGIIDLSNRLYVKFDATGSNTGTSWTNAFNKLQDALLSAGTCNEVVEIWVAKGTYYPDEGLGKITNDRNASFVMRDNLAIYGGFFGNETQLSERSWQANETILSGDIDQNDGAGFTNNDGNSFHVVFNKQNGLTNTSILDGFTVKGGNADGPADGFSWNGGGIYNNDVYPMIRNCTFSYNSSKSFGGALLNILSETKVINCVFDHNKADAGGAILNYSANVSITNSVFTANEAASSGGAINDYSESSSEITNCRFLSNKANSVGGALLSYSSSSPIIINSIFLNNSATSYGGAICNSATSQSTSLNCSFWNNTAPAASSVASLVNSSFVATNCIFWGNDTYPIQHDGSSSETIAYCIAKTPVTLPGTGNLNSDPLFVDAINGDLHLQRCSPGVNKGNDAANNEPTDLDGNSRKVGTIDMGAYEASVPSISIVYVNKNATGLNNGSSWQDAYTTLQDALAVPCLAYTQIWVAKGTYYPDEGGGNTDNDRAAHFAMRNDLAIYGGFAGTTETNLGQRNWVTNTTILSGEIRNNGDINDNSYHVVKSSGVNNTAILDGFTISEGNASGNAPDDKKGGGIYNVAASPSLTNCNFSGNNANFGGGIYNTPSSFPVLINCSFTGNNATTGGGIYNVGASPILTNCNFLKNTALYYGGGIHNDISSSAKITDCIFSENRSSYGGAINIRSSSPELTNCNFFDNAASIIGGAISNDHSSPLFTNSRFFGNAAIDGGGAFFNDASSSPVITNCSFSGNTTVFGSGALYSVGNSSPTLTNCIVWGNTGRTGEIDEDGVSTTVVTYSIVKGDYAGAGNLDQDPLFVDAVNGNLRLQSGSPAINAGEDAANNTTYDLDNNARKVGTIDMGAYELQSSTPGCTDEIAPAFTGSYADVNLSCNPANPNGSLGSATATDAGGTVTITSTDGPVVSDGCNRSKTRTFTATDGCNNTATIIRTVRWISDLTAPTLTTGGTSTSLGCNPSSGDINGALGTATATDACSTPTVTSSDGAAQSTGCNRSQTRTWTARDACGNTSTASRTVTWLSDLTAPTLTTGGTSTSLGCNPSSIDINGGLGTATATDACSSLTVTSSDGNVTGNGCSRSQTRTFIAIDVCGNTSTASRTVTWISDLTPPSFTGTYPDIDAGYNPVNPQGSLGAANAIDACGAVTISSQDGSVVSNGCNRSITRTFTAKDGCNNTATVSRKVTWISDVTPPTVLTKGITVPLTTGGSVTITASQVDNGSSDVCGIANYSLSKYTFNCSNVGPNTVTLTATDASGNSASATGIVTVVDNLSPTVNTQNVTIYLNASGQASVTAGQVNNNSTDNCSIPVNGYVLSKTSFDCTNVGQNTVTLKVTDVNNNTATASATITVVDNTPPTVNTKNPTIYLNALGQATLTVAQVNNTSTDNCSITSNGYLLSKTNFDCLNAGPNTVTLKVTDASGNTATANATVTVVDNLAPVANCKNITVNLGTNGIANITGANLNNNSTDNCQSSLSFSASRTSFNSDDLGTDCEKTFGVVFTATDGSGNSSTCSATVTVKRRITKLVYNGAAEGQYSDPANLSSTLYDITDGEPGVAVANKTIKFTLGAQTVSDIYGGSGGGTTAGGVANGTLILNQDPTPVYSIVCNFAGDGVYCSSSSSASFDIKPEDLCSQYNGQLSVKASVLSKTNSSAKVVTSVGIADATDGNAGDVTKAKIEFNYGSGWITVPVQALNAAKTIGNATYTATINFSGDGSTLNFNYRISGYYQINQECSDNGQSVINVYKPQGEFITGGGYIVSTNRSVGIMPADEGRRANFGFNVKYNQKNTSLLGNISYIFRRKVNDVVRLYQVKGNSMTSLVVNMNDATEGGMKTAVFIGKCNVTDVTDPLAPVSVAGTGNSIMQVIITDASETGVNDKYGITIWTPTNQVLHSSNWEGTKTTKLVLGDGDVVVGGITSAPLTKTNNTGTGSSTPEVDRSATVEKTKPRDEDLKVTVMPNPSSANFRIVVNSNDLKAPVKLFVTDMLGRMIETRITNAGQTITIGDKYISGTYAVRIMQGRKTRQLTLIKLSD